MNTLATVEIGLDVLKDLFAILCAAHHPSISGEKICSYISHVKEILDKSNLKDAEKSN
jgi:hypothetical protein